jgi:hypothetical protein
MGQGRSNCRLAAFSTLAAEHNVKWSIPTTLDSSNDIAETVNNSLEDCEACHIPVYDVHRVERDLQEFDEWIFGLLMIMTGIRLATAIEPVRYLSIEKTSISESGHRIP